MVCMRKRRSLHFLVCLIVACVVTPHVALADGKVITCFAGTATPLRSDDLEGNTALGPDYSTGFGVEKLIL